jgi:nucleotide-binding universal stress UspA family protein
MTGQPRILLAIDDSAASRKAVDYVAELARTKPEAGVCLFHAAASMPPELQEFRGAEDAKEETELENQLEGKQEHWKKRAEKTAEPVLGKARSILQSSGIAPEQIESRAAVLLHREDLIDEILRTAREYDCDTIVVGRQSFPWLKELFVDHLGEKINAKSERIAVRIVD